MRNEYSPNGRRNLLWSLASIEGFYAPYDSKPDSLERIAQDIHSAIGYVDCSHRLYGPDMQPESA